MRIYLAARYSRHREMQDHAALLRLGGHVVTSRWIEGNHQITDEEMENNLVDDKRRLFADHDVMDLLAAECCISFTEPPHSNASRGGRHVEFGIALALRMPVYVVGYRENIFHCLPQVQFYKNWTLCHLALKRKM